MLTCDGLRVSIVRKQIIGITPGMQNTLRFTKMLCRMLRGIRLRSILLGFRQLTQALVDKAKVALIGRVETRAGA